MRQVVEIREFFDNYERNMNKLWGRFPGRHYENKNGLSDNMKPSSKSEENLKFNKHNNFVSEIDKIYQQDENQSCHTLSSSTSNLLRIIALERFNSPRSASVSFCCPPSSPSPRKCFYLPEEKIYSNELLVKIRQHFDKSHDKQRYSSRICNVDSTWNQNKIGTTKNHKSASLHSSELDGVQHFKNDGDLTSPLPLFNECDQKIFHLNEFDTSAHCSSAMDSFKFNESTTTVFHHQPLPLEEPLCCRVSKQKQQSALIKNDNAISCRVGNDLKLEMITQDATNSSTSTHHHAISNKLSRVMAAVGDEKQKHYHCKDLKPIKSLELATTKANRRENEIADDGNQQQEQEPLAKHKQQQQYYQKQVYDDERYNSILMNDDCKLQQKQQQMQDEQTSSSDGTCRDKYFKVSKDGRRGEMLLKNDLRFNEISTNNFTSSTTSGKSSCRENAEINSIRNNLNFDLFFDKELSAWSSMRKRTDNEIPITEIQMRSSNDFESYSCTKLDNETIANYGCSISETTSDSSDDCTSTTSSSSDSHIITTKSSCDHQTANSIYLVPHTSFSVDNNSIKTTEAHCSNATKNNIRLFTDGTYIYGPYNFDLFTNSFYHFRDDTKFECDIEEKTNNDGDNDEASFLQHHDKRKNHINTELLKNHDDINTVLLSSATAGKVVSCVRDMDPTDEFFCEKNNDNDRVILNDTNYLKDDERDFAKWKGDKNFNYSYSSVKACDHYLIDLMDGGDSYVSKNHDKDNRDLHRPTLTDYVDAVSKALLLTATTDVTAATVDLNNSEQFNYERDKIVEITDDDDALATVGDGGSCGFSYTSHIAQCTTAVNEKFSNHKVPKIKILGCDGNCVDSVGRDSTENEIRFRECVRRGMYDKLYSSVNDNCHRNDNIARDERQG